MCRTEVSELKTDAHVDDTTPEHVNRAPLRHLSREPHGKLLLGVFL